MDLFSKCKALYEKIRYFEYGIPVDGVIKSVPSPEYFTKNYHFLKPEEFEKYGGGICWDYVEYERKFLEVNDIDFNQYYLITNTPPNYDTHTFITVKDGDELIYIESSFKRVEHIIDGVQKFKSLEDIVRLITTNMWYCNDNDKHFDEFKYDVCKFKGHPQYGCTCEEYMKWMDDNSDIVIQDVTINPKKVNEDELTVEEFSVNKIDTKFTQFVCESANDPEEYDETLHDHIDDEDDIYNESWTDFKNGVHPSSGLMFHVSLKNDMDGKTINPQLPSYITDGGELDDNYQEDTKTKRLCVSPSIEGCLIAILSYNKIREHVGDKFYVYTPEKPFSQYKHKTNKEIVKDKLVFDANITKEAWILEPCKLKLYGIIKLKKVKDLKKKPTVEKNIKMNTIKLDYEWIMTPKASGKFNKAIGDSPDKDDKKEKPTKEAFELSTDEEIFTEAKSFKQTIREEQTKNTRVSNVNSESKFKAIFKDYLSNIDVPSYPNTIQFKNPDKIDKNVISSKKFDIDTYRSAFTHLKSLYNKLLSAIKNNDLVHSKSYRNKIGELIGRSIENNIIFIDINEGNIEINIGAKTFRKLDSSKYDLFVHRSNNPNLSSIKPTIGTASGTGIFMYKSSVVYMFAFEKTSDINKRKKQFEIFDHYISSSYGDNLYLYKPTSSNVFCIDDNLMKRPGLPFNASMIPVNIETKNPLPVTKISESELKKLLNIDDESEEKPIKEYAVPGSFYHDIKPHPGGVYALVEDDSYRSHFCHIDFQGHDNKYLGWNAPTGSELILKTQEVIKSEKWEFRKSETDTVIPEYTHIFTYAQQILPIIRLDKIKDRLNELLAPHCPLTVHDPNSDTDIEYVCIQPQQYEVIDKKQTSYVYDTAYKEMFENHIVYLPIVDNLGMFEVKHTTHVAGTYDDNLFFEELFYGPTISYKLFDAFKDLNSVTLYDISDINAWDFACDYEDHYDEDGERIEPGDPKHPSNKRVNESANVLVSNKEFFEEFVSSKQRNREKKFLKERNFVPDKDNPNKGWIDSDFKDKNGKPKRIRFEINNDSVIASTNSEDRIQMTRKALRTHPGISSADFKHEEGHMFAKQKYKEWVKSHPKPEDMTIEDHMNEFYKSGEFKDFFTRVAKDLEKAAEKGMSEHGKNLEEYFADAFALANSLNESMDIKSIRTMGSRINSNKKHNKLLNQFNENIDNITNYLAKSMISMTSNDIKWIKDCPEDIRNNEHFKKLRKAISDCQLYKKLIQIEERTKEFDRGLINIFNSSLNDFKSLHDQKSIEAKAKLKRNKEEMMAKIKKQDEKIQSMKVELKNKKKFVEDCKKDIHNLYKASAAANSNLTKMQKEIIDDVKKSQQVLNNEIEFRAKMLEKLSKDEKNQLKIKESYDCILMDNEEFFMEANKNLVKSLKILDYDPKTKTIKCDIPRYDGKPNKRVIFLIDDYISQERVMVQ